MRAAKTEALRREVDILAQSQEREVDRLDSIIALLLKVGCLARSGENFIVRSCGCV